MYPTRKVGHPEGSRIWNEINSGWQVSKLAGAKAAYIRTFVHSYVVSRE